MRALWNTKISVFLAAFGLACLCAAVPARAQQVPDIGGDYSYGEMDSNNGGNSAPLHLQITGEDLTTGEISGDYSIWWRNITPFNYGTVNAMGHVRIWLGGLFGMTELDGTYDPGMSYLQPPSIYGMYTVYDFSRFPGWVSDTGWFYVSEPYLF